jgi:hypothetical protein
MASNMDTVGLFSVAKEMAKVYLFYFYYSIEKT